MDAFAIPGGVWRGWGSKEGVGREGRRKEEFANREVRECEKKEFCKPRRRRPWLRVPLRCLALLGTAGVTRCAHIYVLFLVVLFYLYGVCIFVR